MSEPGNGITPIRVKLRRIYDKDEFIEKNLQNMQVRSFKKKYAQSRYYGRKNVMNVINENVNKLPIHSRLGPKRINLRRGAYQFANNDFINNRFPLRRKLIRNQGIPSTLQNRLRLRRSGTRFFQNKTTDYTIQIRNNLANSNNYNNMINNMKHSCIGQLNDQLQSEISVIQREADNAPPEDIPSLPIHVAGYGVTNISLNQRFSI